jgi:hypothetical protein
MSIGAPAVEPRPVRRGFLTYILPLRAASAAAARRLDAYLEWLGREVELIVVDASPPEVFAENARRWAGAVHVAPRPALRSANGKVWGVLTGLELASHEKVIVADDDVRYDVATLAKVAELLDEAAVVRVQNFFLPAPWHARWDTGRSLLNRVSGGDWPGTMAVRRSFLPDGYDGSCLFENLELVRTVRAAGGREYVALDVFVRRLPPSTAHFLSQRVRQAYDELARPGRLVAQLALLPLLVAAGRRRRAVLLTVVGCSVALAELGRRRRDGTKVWPGSCSLAAPLWVVERAICVWLAVLVRVLHGGIRYHGELIARPATPERELAQRWASRSVAR